MAFVDPCNASQFAEDICRKPASVCDNWSDPRRRMPLIDAKEVMSMRLRALVYLAVLVIPALASATTITVRREGTGDYSVIQPALDAAADGDMIVTGPANHAEATVVCDPRRRWCSPSEV